MKPKMLNQVDIAALELIEAEAGEATYKDVAKCIPGCHPAFAYSDIKAAKRVLYRLAARGYVQVDHMPHGCCNPHAWRITEPGKRYLREKGR